MTREHLSEDQSEELVELYIELDGIEDALDFCMFVFERKALTLRRAEILGGIKSLERE